MVGGELNIARNAAQLGRLRATYASEQDWPDTDLVLLDATRTAERVRVADAVGGLWTRTAPGSSPQSWWSDWQPRSNGSA